MFFPRLRRRAKPVFVALALVFGLSFLALGVGTGVSGSSVGDILSDIFRAGGTDRPSVEDVTGDLAKGKTEKLSQLSALLQSETRALREDGRLGEAESLTQQAIAGLERYVERKPRDVVGLEQLASVYNLGANEARNRAAAIQAESQVPLFGQLFAPQGPLGQALGQNRITQALSQQAARRVTAAIEEMQREYRKVAGVYQKLALLQPEEPSLFLQLGQASQLAGDNESAIAAYKTFLELSPDDALAPSVREQVRALEGTATAGSAG